MIKRLLFIISMVLTFPLTSFADYLQTVNESQGEYVLVLRIDPNNLKLQQLKNNFTKITLTDAHPIGAIGDPSLPVISRLFDVKATEYTATINVADPVVFSNVKVFPIQPDHTENMPAKPFAYNAKVYALDQTPSISLEKLTSIGNGKALTVRVSPFARHGNQLILFKTITIHLKPSLNAKPIAQQDHAVSNTLFNYHQQHLLVTPLQNKDVATPKTLGTVMVLTNSALFSDAEAYASLHPEYQMEVTTIAEGATFQDVKKIISDRYARGNLDTVVLYGDEAIVAQAKWDDYDSDSFYQYLDPANPTYTKIAIGRIPVQNHSDAEFYNAKLAAYLTNHTTHPSKKVMLIAHNQGYPGAYTANQEAIRTAPNPMELVYNTQYGGLNATDASVIKEASNHYALINYRGHGDDEDWWDWDHQSRSFGVDQVNLLNNLNENVTVFFNVACDTGTFETPKRNLAENMIFVPNKGSAYRGGVAVLGASNPSYTDVNDRFDIHLFEFMEKQNNLPLGHVVALANDKLVEESGDLSDNIKMYVLFGDPLITLW